jgi:hypothetical protein
VPIIIKQAKKLPKELFGGAAALPFVRSPCVDESWGGFRRS